MLELTGAQFAVTDVLQCEAKCLQAICKIHNKMKKKHNTSELASP